MPLRPDDKVASTVHEHLSDYLNRELGHGLRGLIWDGDEDDDAVDQPLIVKDSEGRRFEIELNVEVTELTKEELARRVGFVERMRALQARRAAGGGS